MPATTRPLYVRPVVQKELYDQLDAIGEGRNTAQRALVLAPIDAIGALCDWGHHQRHATGPAISAEDQPRRGSGWAAPLPALYASGARRLTVEHGQPLLVGRPLWPSSTPKTFNNRPCVREALAA